MALERSWLPPPCSRRDGMAIIRLSRHLIITAARRNVAARRLQAARCRHGCGFSSVSAPGGGISRPRRHRLLSRPAPCLFPAGPMLHRAGPSRLDVPSRRSRSALRAGPGRGGGARPGPGIPAALTARLTPKKKPHPCDIAPVRYVDAETAGARKRDTRPCCRVCARRNCSSLGRVVRAAGRSAAALPVPPERFPSLPLLAPVAGPVPPGWACRQGHALTWSEHQLLGEPSQHQGDARHRGSAVKAAAAVRASRPRCGPGWGGRGRPCGGAELAGGVAVWFTPRRRWPGWRGSGHGWRSCEPEVVRGSTRRCP